MRWRADIKQKQYWYLLWYIPFSLFGSLNYLAINTRLVLAEAGWTGWVEANVPLTLLPGSVGFKGAENRQSQRQQRSPNCLTQHRIWGAIAWNPSVASALFSQSEKKTLFLKHIPSTMKWKISFLCSEQHVLLRIFLLKKNPTVVHGKFLFYLNQIFNRKMIMFRVSYKFLAEDWLDVLKSCMTRISVLKT